jgi:hypothetical protein
MTTLNQLVAAAHQDDLLRAAREDSLARAPYDGLPHATSGWRRSWRSLRRAPTSASATGGCPPARRSGSAA